MYVLKIPLLYQVIIQHQILPHTSTARLPLIMWEDIKPCDLTSRLWQQIMGLAVCAETDPDTKRAHCASTAARGQAYEVKTWELFFVGMLSQHFGPVAEVLPPNLGNFPRFLRGLVFSFMSGKTFGYRKRARGEKYCLGIVFIKQDQDCWAKICGTWSNLCCTAWWKTTLLKVH